MAGPPRMLGDSGKHLSLQLTQHGFKMRAVGFGQAEEWFPALQQSSDHLIDLAFRPVINEHRGFQSVEMHIVDWRPHQARSAALQSVG